MYTTDKKLFYSVVRVQTVSFLSAPQHQQNAHLRRNTTKGEICAQYPLRRTSLMSVTVRRKFPWQKCRHHHGNAQGEWSHHLLVLQPQPASVQQLHGQLEVLLPAAQSAQGRTQKRKITVMTAAWCSQLSGTVVQVVGWLPCASTNPSAVIPYIDVKGFIILF